MLWIYFWIVWILCGVWSYTRAIKDKGFEVVVKGVAKDSGVSTDRLLPTVHILLFMIYLVCAPITTIAFWKIEEEG